MLSDKVSSVTDSVSSVIELTNKNGDNITVVLQAVANDNSKEEKPATNDNAKTQLILDLLLEVTEMVKNTNNAELKVMIQDATNIAAENNGKLIDLSDSISTMQGLIE